MKTIQLVLRSAMAICFAFMMSSASCDLFEKVDDVTFKVELVHDFKVNETFNSNGAEKAYSSSELLDAAKVNSEFDTYKDKFKSITINKITYTVMNYVPGPGGDVVFKNGKLGFSNSTGSTASVVASLAVQSLQAAVGNELTLSDVSQAGLDEIANLLKNDKKVNIYTFGTFSKTPVAFTVKVKLDCTVVANAL